MASQEGKKEILDFINFKHEVLVQHYAKKEKE
jgi:hypothetical protein